ncbi:hypothetical protein Slin15195_G097840 [Septoria linicola]|uniref:Uncharacterized protein n=1 Tax=Septoria linicola TaxID=215465 RepID=A0A9Q9AWK2_9PEZI|nr:hypothetical protein Slin15195_G097840 [Septoria linicola]
MARDRFTSMLDEDGPSVAKARREVKTGLRGTTTERKRGGDAIAKVDEDIRTLSKEELVPRSVPDSSSERQVSSKTSSAIADTLEQQHEAVALDRPANSRRKQSFLHVTSRDEDIDPTMIGSSLQPSNTRRKQSFLHVTALKESHNTDLADDMQSPTQTQISTSSNRSHQDVAGLANGEWQAGDLTEADVANAVQDTLRVIREHREYLDQSRAAARRNENILARLAATPTASWKAKQKPSVGPGNGTVNVSGTPLPRSAAPSVAVRPVLGVTRGRPGTALADRVVTNGVDAREVIARSRSGARRKRRSASTGSVVRTRSSGISKIEAMATTSRDLVDVLRQRLHEGEAPCNTNAAQLKQAHKPDDLPRVEEQINAGTACEANGARSSLLDATILASPAPLSTGATRPFSRNTQTAARQPPQVPQMSSARAKSKQSTFARTIRPDPFAPKAEINTRISTCSIGRTGRSRQFSDKSSAPRHSNVSERPEGRPKSHIDNDSAEHRESCQERSDEPPWRRLSQQSTVSWSSKGKAAVKDGDHFQKLHAMINDRPLSSHSSLQAPNSSRISWVGEDFDVGMEGSIRDRLCTAQRCDGEGGKAQDRARQDSGGNTDDNAVPDSTAQREQSALVNSLDLAASMVYDEVVTAWNNDAGWLFSVADQKRLGEYEALTIPLRTVRALRSSTKMNEHFPNAETFQAMIDRAHRSLGKPQSHATGHANPVIVSSVNLNRARRNSTSLMTRTKNFLLAPFKLGGRLKGGRPSGRPRRGSTGSLVMRPTLIPNMANGTQVTISHANSLRPEHNPALIRSTVPGSQPQTARLPKRRTAQPRVRSSLTTHEEETEEEERPWFPVDMEAQELPAEDVIPSTQPVKAMRSQEIEDTQVVKG